MYSVMLVDDEESVLNTLKTSIDWQELGVDTLLTASNGRAALDLFECRQIDLLVTDICMPVMDGMELIRNVRQLRPETHCVLLTAYGEFEYAKEAIRLGVDNYLLKPMSRDEMIQTIQTALDNVYKRRSNSRTLLQENILRRWAAGTISGEELSERAAVLGINLYQPIYCAVCMGKRGGASIARFRSACCELLQSSFDIYSFWDEKDRFIIILGGKSFQPEQLRQELSQLVKRLEMENAAALSVGTPVTEAELLHLSCQSACDALEVAGLTAAGGVVPATEAPPDLLTEELRELFYEPSAQVRQQRYQQILSRLCKEDGSYSGIFPELSRIYAHALAKEFPTQSGFQEQLHQWTEQNGQIQSEGDGKAADLALMEYSQVLFAQCFGQFCPMVQRAVQYIRIGVREGAGVSIKEFCAQCGVTAAYLGHMFKKETSVFFNDYLMSCRINRSLALLRNPNQKIKDIAEAVGFASPSYYVKCFRDYKGVSPAKYRQDQESGRY